jgi:cytochrome c
MRVFAVAACVWLAAVGAPASHEFTAEEQAAVPPPRSEGLYTSTQAARGKKIYAERCVLCHLEDLSGDQLYNPGPELAGRVFRARWKGRTVLELLTLIKTTMPLHTPGTLTDREAADLVAYIFEANKFPSGSGELSPDHDALATLLVPAGE